MGGRRGSSASRKSRSPSPAPRKDKDRSRSRSPLDRRPAKSRSRSRGATKGDEPRRKGGYYKYNFDEKEATRTLFLANIADSANEFDVQDLFSKTLGFDVNEVSLPRSPSARTHRGYGFVHLKDDRDVDDCVKKANGYELRGKPLKVEEKQSRPPRSKGFKKGDDYGRGRRDSRGRGGHRGDKGYGRDDRYGSSKGGRRNSRPRRDSRRRY
ncbi:unnamed protein product [Amoebophrya sp. A120]|nr:unnamed protein product [Amoebophrya sp. A120]|eukprot:GSA120T00011578001.1